MPLIGRLIDVFIYCNSILESMLVAVGYARKLFMLFYNDWWLYYDVDCTSDPFIVYKKDSQTLYIKRSVPIYVSGYINDAFRLQRYYNPYSLYDEGSFSFGMSRKIFNNRHTYIAG